MGESGDGYELDGNPLSAEEQLIRLLVLKGVGTAPPTDTLGSSAMVDADSTQGLESTAMDTSSAGGVGNTSGNVACAHVSQQLRAPPLDVVKNVVGKSCAKRVVVGK